MNQHELVSKWSHVITDLPVPTWSEPWTLAALAEMSSTSNTILEMGCFMGMSTLVMLRANPNVHIWSCDIFSAFEFNKELASFLLKDYINQGRCELIRGTSDTAADMLQHMQGSIDGMFIDGAHDTVNVKNDIKNLIPLLRGGRYALGHDFDIPHNDVALGVIQSGITYDVPYPRVWRHQKP